MQMTLAQAAVLVDGRLLGADRASSGVSTDTRKLLQGSLFVALVGDQYDGHDFLADAARQGAAGALVAAGHTALSADCGLALIEVADTRQALGKLAAGWRARFDLPLIAVTGSNGKTTTKEMIASILRVAHGDAVLATVGNLNNDIGLPLTLLQLDAGHRAAIVEMGMNRPGEIAWLTALARPTVAVVTNAQRAHLLGMGSLSAIADEKGAIYGGLGDAGVAVINADDAHAARWIAQNAGHRCLSFSAGKVADVCGRIHLHGLETVLDVDTAMGGFSVELAIPGAHNARNALAATAAALAAGVDVETIRAGLASFSGVKGRLQRHAGPSGSVLLDDTYNANPDSVRAGIDVLAGTVGRKVLVLGDMGEIGAASGQFHDEIGGYAKSAGIDRLYTLGEASAIAARNFGEGAMHCMQLDELLSALSGVCAPGVTLLVKGSRFMRMERVVEALRAAAESAGEGASPCC